MLISFMKHLQAPFSMSSKTWSDWNRAIAARSRSTRRRSPPVVIAADSEAA
jgi:hypothetical protein